MRKIFLLFILLFLTGCSNSKINDKYMIGKEATIYAYNINNKEIEEVNIIYNIENVEDVFKLYTIYQNTLPLGYVSMSTCNVGLIDYKIEDNTCYYYVDKYISLVDDLEIFSSILKSTNRLLGYKETKIIYNDNIIA